MRLKINESFKYAMYIALLFLTIFLLLRAGWAALKYRVSEDYRYKHAEIYQPCDLMDPIRLMIGETIVSYPAKLDAYVYEDETTRPYPRRAIRGTGLGYQMCDEGEAYHFASRVSIKFQSSKNWSMRWDKQGWVPVGVHSGIAIGTGGVYLGRDKVQTGYKNDLSFCYIREENSHESCRLVRYLEDLNLHISVNVTTTDINLFGRETRIGERQTREQWPEYMDNLEVFWRGMIIDEEAAIKLSRL